MHSSTAEWMRFICHLSKLTWHPLPKYGVGNSDHGNYAQPLGQYFELIEINILPHGLMVGKKDE